MVGWPGTDDDDDDRTRPCDDDEGVGRPARRTADRPKKESLNLILPILGSSTISPQLFSADGPRFYNRFIVSSKLVFSFGFFLLFFCYFPGTQQPESGLRVVIIKICKLHQRTLNAWMRRNSIRLFALFFFCLSGKLENAFMRACGIRAYRTRCFVWRILIPW